MIEFQWKIFRCHLTKDTEWYSAKTLNDHFMYKLIHEETKQAILDIQPIPI